MSAVRRENSQSPDPAVGPALKNGFEMLANGTVPVQPTADMDHWHPHAHQVFGHGGLGNNSAGAPVSGEYLANYYANLNPSYDGTWNGFYRGGLSSPVSSPYAAVDHMNMFGQNSYLFGYYHTNGSDYNAWGPSALSASPSQTNSRDGMALPGKHSDFYYGDEYSDYVGTNMHGSCDRSTVSQLGHAISRLNIGDDQQNVCYPGAAANPSKKTWASVASQPAKTCSGNAGVSAKKVKPPQTAAEGFSTPNSGYVGGSASAQFWSTADNRASTVLPKGTNGYCTSLSPNANSAKTSSASKTNYIGGGTSSSASSDAGNNLATENGELCDALVEGSGVTKSHPVLEKLKAENEYNPQEYNLPTKGARYFVIKSYSEDDIHRSIKYGIWCSTEHGNKRLDSAYREREGKGPIFLFFSVNGSGHFCGLAQMISPLDYTKNSGVWSQDKWKGQFAVKWIYVKDVPNSQLRHIRLENNENKPVTNSRDTQEVPAEKGRQVLKLIHNFRHTTSLFDDFSHYEKRQEEEDQRRAKGRSED